MKAVVTGAYGFLGRTVCQKLLNTGWEILGISKSDKPSEFGGEWVKLNLLTEEIPEIVFKDVDVVIHLAASVGEMWNNLEALLLANEMMLINTFKNCNNAKATLVFSSSQYVYGNISNTNITEDAALQGYNTKYGCSKINCENWLRYFQKQKGGNVKILRLTGFVEGGGVIDYFIKQAIKNEDIILYEYGKIARDYIALSDGVQAIINAASIGSKTGVCIYNIGSGNGINMYDLAKFVCDILGSSSKIILSNEKARLGNFVFNIEKAKSELLYKPGPVWAAIRAHVLNEPFA